MTDRRDPEPPLEAVVDEVVDERVGEVLEQTGTQVRQAERAQELARVAEAGARQAEERKEGESFALYERQFGSFSRSFSLPDMADGERIEAKLENGVLTLTIAKKAEAKPRKIALKK